MNGMGKIILVIWVLVSIFLVTTCASYEGKPVYNYHPILDKPVYHHDATLSEVIDAPIVGCVSMFIVLFVCLWNNDKPTKNPDRRKKVK